MSLTRPSSQNFISGAADNTIRLWDVESGKELERIGTKTAVRSCAFSYSGNQVAYTTDKQMGYPCIISVVDVRNFSKGTYTLHQDYLGAYYILHNSKD